MARLMKETLHKIREELTSDNYIPGDTTAKALLCHIDALESEHQQAIQLERAAIVREAADRVEHLQFTYDGTSPRQEAVAAILAITTDQPALDRALAEVKRKERLATRLEIAELVHSTILQNRDIALHDILTELWKDVLNTE